MKSYKTVIYLLGISLCLMCSCGNSGTGGKKKRQAGAEVKMVTSVSPVFGAQYKQGSNVDIKYTLAVDLEPDSVVLEVAGKRVGKIGTDGHTLRLASDQPVGRTVYRITAYKDGKQHVRPGEFTVLAARAPVIYGHRVKRTHPHSKDAYTQGLLWHKGHLYESTGLEGESTLRKTEISGKVLKSLSLASEYFGEGLALLDDKLYQLTWQNKKGFVYDLESFEKLGEFTYQGEGWGLTTDGTNLYMSEGTEKIFVMDPKTFKRIRTIEVYTDQRPMTYINEMEWIDGEIWANIFTTDTIIRIDPETGAVIGVVDMGGLLTEAERGSNMDDVLNGIAYDHSSKKIYVTGKRWPKLFEIEVFIKE